MDGIKGILLDLDGTVWQSGRLIDGAAEAIQSIRTAGMVIRFTTNITRKPRRALLKQLRRLGIDVELSDIITAPSAAAIWLRQHNINRIFPLIEASTLEDFEGCLVTEDNPEVVLVGDLGEKWDFALLNKAFFHLRNGARLVAIHKNRYWQKDDQLVLDAGPFVAALEYATGLSAELVGKPSPAFFNSAIQSLGLVPEQVLVVGDDLDSDIQGAKNSGIKCALVRTGKYREGDLSKAKVVPDFVIESIRELPSLFAINM